MDACEWKEEDGEFWRTSCGHDFVLEYGTPKDNDMCFCCYCGRPLVTKKTEFYGPEHEEEPKLGFGSGSSEHTDPRDET